MTDGAFPRRRRRGALPAVLLGGAMNALSVARSLWRMGVPVDVLGDGVSESPVRFSRSRRRYVEAGPSGELIDQWLHTLLGEAEPSVVLPCCDHGLELVARHRAALEAAGHLPIEANDEVVLALLDKSTTYELARRAGVPAPRTLELRTRDDLEQATEFLFPCAVKPVHSHVFSHQFRAAGKGALVRDLDDAARLTEPALAVGISMLLTEVVEGTDECCSYFTYLDQAGAPMTQLTKRKLRQYPTRFGLGTYHVTGWDSEVADLGLRFFQHVGLRGVGNIEFKRDVRDGVLKIIEANPRVTNANELLRAAGVDLAWLAYGRLVGLDPPAIPAFRDDLALWFPVDDVRALRDYRARRELSAREWARTLLRKQCHAIFDWADPWPIVVNTTRRLGRLGHRVRRMATAG